MHLIGMDLKGMRDAARTEDQRAGRAADGLITDPCGDLALKDVEALVLFAVDVASPELFSTFRNGRFSGSTLTAGANGDGRMDPGSRVTPGQSQRVTKRTM